MKKIFIFTSLLIIHLLINSTHAASITQDWQGEWGNWKYVKNNLDKNAGSNISIYNCDEAKKTCAFRLDYFDSSKSSDEKFENLSGIFIIQSRFTATGTQIKSPWACSDECIDCTKGIKFTKNFFNKQISISVPKNCRIREVPNIYPFRARNNYPGFDIFSTRNYYPKCYEENQSELVKTWCNDPEVFQLDLVANKFYGEYLKLYDETSDYLKFSNKDADNINQWRDKILTTCQSDPQILACLKKNYQQTITNITNLVSQTKVAKEQYEANHQKMYNQLTSEAGNPQKASPIINNIQGVYKYNTNNLEQILEIVKVNDSTIYFRAKLAADSSNGCDISGLASYKNSGYFLFNNNHNKDWRKPSEICLLKLKPTNDKISLSVVQDFNCREYCDLERFYLDNFSFANKLRKPIRYLARIRNSSEYQSALEN